MRGKIIWSILVVFLSLAIPAYAQQKPNADDVVAKLAAKLNLTSDQVTAIKPIIEDSMAQHQKLMQSMRDEIATIRSQMDQLKKEDNQKLSQILNKSQMSQWMSMQTHKHRMHHIVSQGVPSSTGNGTSK